MKNCSRVDLQPFVC